MLRFYLNDRLVEEAAASSNQTLLRYLRSLPRLSGTKEGCAEGDCGACTVVIIDKELDGTPAYKAINSCIVLLPSLHGKRVYTVEGLRRNGDYHPVQEAMVEALGSQCGYCTPGFVMSLFAAYYRKDITESWQKEDQLAGNLCRCTGYRPIRDALEETVGKAPEDHFVAQLKKELPQTSLSYKSKEGTFFMPQTLAELWDIFEHHPNYQIVVGATDLGLEITKKKRRFQTLVSLERIAEMRGIEDLGNAWRIGAVTTLSQLESFSQRDWPDMARMLRYFGARQIKNRATLGGNLCNASPIGDTPPVLLAHKATFIVGSIKGRRFIPAEEFFVDYRQTALQDKEVLLGVEIPKPNPSALRVAYKVSKRRELDISAVSASFYLVIEKQRVADVRLAYGGMAAVPKRAHSVEAFLLGKLWSEDTISEAIQYFSKDFTPMTDHRATSWYRLELAKNFLIGFFHETKEEAAPALTERHSATIVLERQT